MYPSPTRPGSGCIIKARSKHPDAGRLLIYDVGGRIIRLLRASSEGSELVRISWDGRDRPGNPVASGIYFMRYDDGVRQAGGKILMID